MVVFYVHFSASDCPDCAGFAPDCPCSALDICEREGCSNTGECSRGTCTQAKKRSMFGDLLRRTSSDCPDCAGFAPDCPCSALDICEREGCSNTGECSRGTCTQGKKRSMFGDLLKRTSATCADCAGFGPDCPCYAIDICKKEGCSKTGECSRATCKQGERKRLMYGALLKRGSEICSDCAGFPPGCPCADALLCSETGCASTGECTADNCSHS